MVRAQSIPHHCSKTLTPKNHHTSSSLIRCPFAPRPPTQRLRALHRRRVLHAPLYTLALNLPSLRIWLPSHSTSTPSITNILQRRPLRRRFIRVAVRGRTHCRTGHTNPPIHVLLRVDKIRIAGSADGGAGSIEASSGSGRWRSRRGRWLSIRSTDCFPPNGTTACMVYAWCSLFFWYGRIHVRIERWNVVQSCSGLGCLD